MTSKKVHKLLIKLLISSLMLVLVFCFVDIAKLEAVVGRLSFSSVLLVAAGYVGTQIVSSIRWWLLIRASGMETKYLQALRAFFIGMYLNCFGLGTVGGDVARGLMVIPEPGQAAKGLGSVVADRALGLGTLAAIGVTAALLVGLPGAGSSLLIVALITLIAVPAAWLVAPRAIRRVVTIWPGLHGKIAGLTEAFPSRLAVLCRVVAVALLFHLLQITLFGAVLRMLGASVPWPQLLATVPFANIAGTLPLSWMGVGIRENVYVLLLVPTYLTTEQAVVAGVVWFAGMTLASVIGGLVAFTTSTLPSSAELPPTPQRSEGF